jgi:hypothetical protein
MIILTDVDGVLLNWEEPFHAWMAAQGFQQNSEASYQLDRCYPDLEPKFVFDKIRTFNSSAHMGFLNPIGDARQWVRRINHMFGATFHCITSMGNDHCASKLRTMNLQAIFGKKVISQVTFLDCGADKTSVLRLYENSNLMWLEDHIGNANTGASLGLDTFLFNRPYNLVNPTSKPERFTRVDNWKQIATHLMNK